MKEVALRIERGEEHKISFKDILSERSNATKKRALKVYTMPAPRKIPPLPLVPVHSANQQPLGTTHHHHQQSFQPTVRLWWLGVWRHG